MVHIRIQLSTLRTLSGLSYLSLIFGTIILLSSVVLADGRQRTQPQSMDADVLPPSMPSMQLCKLFRHTTIPLANDQQLTLSVLTPKTNQRVPFIVWVHGIGPFEREEFGHLNFVDLLIPEPSAPLDFGVIAIQCPKDGAWQSSVSLAGESIAGSTGEEMSMLDAHWRCIQHTIRTTPSLDPDRVSIVGISSGGAAAIRTAARHPNAFAALVAFSVGNMRSQGEQVLPTTWIFNSARDAFDPRAVLPDLTAHRSRGGIGRLTVVNDGDYHVHDTWRPGFEQYDLKDWLTKQNRTSLLRTQWPGRARRDDFLPVFDKVMTYLPMVSLFTVLAGLLYVGRAELERQMARAPHTATNCETTSL